MKVILAIAFLFTVVSAQTSYCVDLIQDDTTCEGLRTNWPSKVCGLAQNVNFSSAQMCDNLMLYDAWHNGCPLKNDGNTTFCQPGGGSFYPHDKNDYFCGALTACSTDEDCNPIRPPYHVITVPVCYDCCLYCHDDDTCEKMAMGPTPLYTKSTNCTPCSNPADGPSDNSPTYFQVLSISIVVFSVVMALTASLC